MCWLRCAGFGVLSSFLSCGPAALAARDARPVAIVYVLRGEVTIAASAQQPRPLRLFDRLPAGAVVTTGPAAHLALAFANGRRYELGERSGATLGAAELTAPFGAVRPLPKVPPLPALAPIAEEERPGLAFGAVRIRREEITLLSPRDGAATLADATLLRFHPVGGVARYRVEIEDAHGAVVFAVDTQASAVPVPSGALAPGGHYCWAVKTLDRPGSAASGEADFVTLSQPAADARQRLRKVIEAAEDDGLRALLIAIDHMLGLVSAESDEQPAGVVIESVAPSSPGEEAGLQPGDRIFFWSAAASPPALPQPASGGVRSPYDLLLPESEEAPRRAVVLHGQRAEEQKVWALTRGEWGIRARPAGDDLPVAWVRDRLAETLAEARKWAEADIAYGEAVAALEQESRPLAAAMLLRRWAMRFSRQGDWDAATERLEKALVFAQMAAPKTLESARTLDRLGVIAAEKADHATAEQRFLKALEIREELAPGTAEVTPSWNKLGIMARRSGDLAKAEEYLTRGEELQRRLAPGNADHARLFQNLGNVALDRRDLERAESFFQQALALFEKAQPEGEGVVDCLARLGNVAMLRGDFVVADDLFRRALALQEQRAPDDLKVSDLLFNLGNLALRRSDGEGAELYYKKARALSEKAFPIAKVDYANNLGVLAAARGDYASARSYFQSTLDFALKQAPGSLRIANSLHQLGSLELKSNGDLARAEDLLRQALSIHEQKAAQNLETAEVFCSLGELLALRGELDEALLWHRRALDLQQKLAPGSEAPALYWLGRAERQAGRLEQATHHFCRATTILDGWRSRAGETPELRSLFESAVGDYHFTCLEGLIELGRTGEAFHALERGRARSFLALLGERDLRLADLPPGLATERREVNAAYDRAQAQLARVDAGRGAAEIERLTFELRDLRRRQEEIVVKLRKASPRAAALAAPQPLDLADARAALDPGTVLLAYAVGTEATWLFVVQAQGTPGPALSVFRIETGAQALSEEVAGFRRLLDGAGSDATALRARARRLYELLVRPAEPRIAHARRILLSPDGSLRTLPFAALVRRGRYLVEWKPVTSVLSATVYAELIRSRPGEREHPEQQLVAFGDPNYPPVTTPDPQVRQALERSGPLQPLPATREEVEAIAALYPRARTHLGREATEESAKALGRETRLIHFACHGLLDERFPLHSALALSLPEHPAEGQENGLLQAWEIFESLRLDADLVTLSACDTALGKDMGGEGLIGLTRAFQYAGARSVLASLWSAADGSTADLMKRFYGHLRAGKTKDEALRAAQTELIRSATFSHPYYWAGFQLTGDWR